MAARSRIRPTTSTRHNTESLHGENTAPDSSNLVFTTGRDSSRETESSQMSVLVESAPVDGSMSLNKIASPPGDKDHAACRWELSVSLSVFPLPSVAT
jgi:hypothetical protein